MNTVGKKYKFWWLIENYSYCWHKNGERLVSPNFIVDEEEGNTWTLCLYPRGYTKEYQSYICICLFYKGEFVKDSKSFGLKSELSILAEDGSILPLRRVGDPYRFNNGYIYLQRDEVLSKKRHNFLPNDTLTVCCNVRIGDGNNLKIGQSWARTRIGIERISFVHIVEDYGALCPNQKKTFQIRSPSEKQRFVKYSIHKTDGACFKEKLVVEIISGSSQSLAKWGITLVDASGHVIEWDAASNLFEETVNDISKMGLRVSRKEEDVTDEPRCLLGNNLTLICDCTFSTGVDFQKIEKTVYEMDKETMEHLVVNDTEKSPVGTSALDDLKAIYTEQFLTDVQLKTKTKSFPAHKLILCARSPVFKVMMCNDMREKTDDCVEIDDLDDDTVHQLLLFLYSDKMEDLQWDAVTKLYYAADKYQIEKLKHLCSDYLEDNLKTDTAIELLILADTHNNSSLKEVVDNFILENDKEIFLLKEWEQLMDENPQLAVKTMHMIYKENNK